MLSHPHLFLERRVHVLTDVGARTPTLRYLGTSDGLAA